MSFVMPAYSTLTIHFNNYVGNTSLKLDSTTYHNELGQAYTISKFKYYISSICLQKQNGEKYTSNTYFLINEEDVDSKQIVLTDIPAGEYSTLSFTIGVDSLHNCSGAQTGALDPINGMFWLWNTGYVFVKMEGKSPASTSPGNLLEFHIGGYKEPYNCIRTVKLNLQNGLILSDKPIQLNIKADLSELFKAPTVVDFSKLSSVTDFHHSIDIANNYKDMFSIMP